MRFRPLIKNSSRYFSRLKRVCHTNIHKHRTSYFKSTLPFLGPAKRWKSICATGKNRKFLQFFIIIMIIFNSRSSFLIQFWRDSSVLHVQMLIIFLSICSYSPEVGAFGTLITSTKVFRLINLQNALTTPPKDPLPRRLRLRT